MISKEGDRQHVEHIFEVKDSKCLSVLFFFICNMTETNLINVINNKFGYDGKLSKGEEIAEVEFILLKFQFS